MSQVITLKPAFTVKDGYLRIRPTRHIAFDSSHAAEVLYYDHKHNFSEVHTLEDLVDRVHISHEKAALSFLRLLTSLRTFYLFRSTSKFQPDQVTFSVEVMDRNTLGLNEVFGDEQMLRSLSKVRNGIFGIASQHTLSQAGIAPASCCPQNAGFSVERTLLIKGLENGKQKLNLQFVRDWVGDNGIVRHELRKTLDIKKHSPHLWSFPSFTD